MYLSGITVMGSGALLLGICFFTLDGDALAYMAIVAIAVFCAGFQMGMFSLCFFIHVCWSFRLFFVIFIQLIVAFLALPTSFIIWQIYVDFLPL